MAFRTAFPLSKRLAAQQGQLNKQASALVSRGYATETSAAQNPNYIAYGAAGVAAVGLIWFFTSSSKSSQTDTKAQSVAAKAGETFQADGKIGKQFTADGAAGGAAQAVGGPFDKDGSVGKQFNKDGAVGGAVQDAGEKVEKKAKK